VSLLKFRKWWSTGIY